MSYNGILQRHWLTVTVHFATDALILVLAFLAGTELRLGSDIIVAKLNDYWPSILLGGLLFPCAAYICGLYTPMGSMRDPLKRVLILAVCYMVALGFMLGMFYINFSARIGRGVMLIGTPLAYSAILLHHVLLLRHWKNFRERVALIVTCAFDEVESQLFSNFWKHHLELAGFIHYDDYVPKAKDKVIGRINQLTEIVERENIRRVLCTNKSINDPAMCSKFSQLRYSGVTVMPLISLCEEVYQNVPLELVTPEWILNASSLPHMFYIKKVKRAFDIVVSLLGLVFLTPVLLLAMLAIRLTSRGPVFYRQVRSGRYGRQIKIVKLRTMTVDAEKNGAVWASKHDSRVTWVGRFLRKYRIDEIPQILNVLRGEMSFVGPRPERPEFIEDLANRIPLYRERLMIQPGITGWAQVNYPYGSSVEDARHKLEYDLYYMKHMSLFLDIFIFLDTLRIILRGGLEEPYQPVLPAVQRLGHVARNKCIAIFPPTAVASTRTLIPNSDTAAFNRRAFQIAPAQLVFQIERSDQR